MEVNEKTLMAAVEALLFIYGEPIETKKLASILDISEKSIEDILETLKSKYEASNSGLSLVFFEKKAQIATKPELSVFVEKLIKEDFEENLTPAALETLSLVAYLGPISRPRVDYLRGVNSSYTIRNLAMRGLIEKVDKGSHTPLYGVSFDLLKNLGVSKIDELPDYQKYRELIVNVEEKA